MCLTSYHRNKLQEVVTITQKERVIELRKQGLTCAEIGKRLNISRQWANTLLRMDDEKPKNTRTEPAKPFNRGKYAKECIDRIAFEVPKGKREVLRAEANKRCISINKLLVTALENQYGIDLGKD
jgi:DNA-binding CsgD family transcriptional regulator